MSSSAGWIALWTASPLVAAFAYVLRDAPGHGWPLEELAEGAEVSVRLVSFLETGKALTVPQRTRRNQRRARAGDVGADHDCRGAADHRARDPGGMHGWRRRRSVRLRLAPVPTMTNPTALTCNERRVRAVLVEPTRAAAATDLPALRSSSTMPMLASKSR